MRKLFITVALATMLAVTACGGSYQTPTEAVAETQAENVTEAVTEAVTEELEEPEEVIVNDYAWDPGELAEFGLTRDEIWEICSRYKELMRDEDALAGYDDEDEYYDVCRAQVAEEYGLDDLDVDTIFFTASAKNYFATFDVNNVKLKYADTEDIMVNDDNVIVIKAKIVPSYSNKATIDQNYFTVCDFIRNYSGDDYAELQYWAVADMTDGSEGKAISFTVPQSVMYEIAEGDFIDNQLGDYVEDLWILPSLTQ